MFYNTVLALTLLSLSACSAEAFQACPTRLPDQPATPPAETVEALPTPPPPTLPPPFSGTIVINPDYANIPPLWRESLSHEDPYIIDVNFDPNNLDDPWGTILSPQRLTAPHEELFVVNLNRIPDGTQIGLCTVRELPNYHNDGNEFTLTGCTSLGSPNVTLDMGTHLPTCFPTGVRGVHCHTPNDVVIDQIPNPQNPNEGHLAVYADNFDPHALNLVLHFLDRLYLEAELPSTLFPDTQYYLYSFYPEPENKTKASPPSRSYSSGDMNSTPRSE